MTSSRAATRSNTSRKFIWLAVAILLVIGGYTAGWYYVADLAVQRTQQALAAVSRTGNRAVCENVEARGYPFRIGINCSATFFEERREGISVQTRALRSAAQIYNPFHAIVEVDAPGRFTMSGFDPLDLSWATLRASVRISRPLPDRVSLEARALSGEVDLSGDTSMPAFSVANAQLHTRPNGLDVDLALMFEDFAPGPAMVGVQDVPAVSGSADLAIMDGVTRIESGQLGLRGTDLQLRALDLTASNGARMRASGPISIDENGLVDARLQLTASETGALSEFLSALFPDAAGQIANVLSGLSLLGEEPTLPLRIQEGRMSLGFVTLGTIPPL